jgi:tryptophan synthase alpha chain
LVYANLALHAGAEAFYARARAAGVDSVLVADAPLLESEPLERAAAAHGIAPVLIAPPNASDERLAAISARSRGYVYVTTRAGVTGVDRANDLRADAATVIRRLGEIDSASSAVGVPPALLGFGIGRAEHVRQAIAMGAAGAISGSAIAARIERHLDDHAAMLTEIGDFVRTMKKATTK